jgi:hypothetical protein
VQQAVAGDAAGGQLGALEGLGSHRLDRVAPEARDVHEVVEDSMDLMVRSVVYH